MIGVCFCSIPILFVERPRLATTQKRSILKVQKRKSRTKESVIDSDLNINVLSDIKDLTTFNRIIAIVFEAFPPSPLTTDDKPLTLNYPCD